MSGFLYGRTLIASDNIARHHSNVGVMKWPERTRRYPAPSDPVDVASLEERIAALETQTGD
jgi:hypothetical protein